MLKSESGTLWLKQKNEVEFMAAKVQESMLATIQYREEIKGKPNKWETH